MFRFVFKHYPDADAREWLFRTIPKRTFKNWENGLGIHIPVLSYDLPPDTKYLTFYEWLLFYDDVLAPELPSPMPMRPLPPMIENPRKRTYDYMEMRYPGLGLPAPPSSAGPTDSIFDDLLSKLHFQRQRSGHVSTEEHRVRQMMDVQARVIEEMKEWDAYKMVLAQRVAIDSENEATRTVNALIKKDRLARELRETAVLEAIRVHRKRMRSQIKLEKARDDGNEQVDDADPGQI